MRPYLYVIAAFWLLAGCGGVGPSINAIVTGSSQSVSTAEDPGGLDRDNFLLVEADRDIASYVSSALLHTDFSPFIGRGAPADVVIGRGDILDIAIVSTSDTGFVDFADASISPISQTPLVPQEVGSDGRVRVPPIGRVPAAGLTVQALENSLTRRLSEVLVQPSVIVNIADRRSARVTVLGKVAGPGNYSINQTDMRLLDMVATAGGLVDRAENLNVRLTRGAATRSASMEDVLQRSDLNVFVRPGDVIELETPEKRVTVLGAVGSRSSTSGNQSIILNQPDANLADVFGNSGGLLNRVADRTGVFLYRDTPKSVLTPLGVNTLPYPGETVPTIYRFDMMDPATLFAARDFAIADGDILFIATSFRDAVEAFTTFVPGPATYVQDATLPLD